VDCADQPHQPDPRADRRDRAEQVRNQGLWAPVAFARIAPLFRFTQLEFPWAIGPPDGRYLLRRPGHLPDAAATHVLVVATLGALQRRRFQAIRGKPKARPEPEPVPVSTGRATIVDVGEPFATSEEAAVWLAGAGEAELAADLAVLNRALHAYRLATADPYLNAVARGQALVARVGYGAGEQVADGQWAQARELLAPSDRQRRAKALQPQARIAAVLSGREPGLACEELTLRARLDLDRGSDREAALQLLIALDAALAELPRDPAAAALEERLSELHGQRDPVARAAQTALAGPLSDGERDAVAFTLARIEAALRARAFASA
jgi:hypothetical protein